MLGGKLRNGIVFGVTVVGLLMSAAAFADVYVPEGSAGTALRLTADLAAAGRITGLGNVHGIDVALSRGVLVSASLTEQARAEIKIPEGMSADIHAAHHATGKKPASGNISIVNLIDIQSGKITRKIEVPGMVHHVTVGANDKYVLVTHPGLDAVSIIDLDKNAVTATIQTGPHPNYAVYDPTTAAFYVSNAGNATVSQVDPAQGYVVRNFKTPAGAEHLDIDVAGRRLFAAEVDAGDLVVLNIDSGAIEATYSIGGELHGVAYDTARNSVYVSAREKGAVAWVNLANGTMDIKDIGAEPYHMVLDGNFLLISSAEEDLIWAVDVTSRQIVKTIPTNARGHQMVVVPGS